MSFRGVGFHEDSTRAGLRDRQRRCASKLVAETKALGATMMRTHYPPHPVPARARRPRGHPALVRGPGLLGDERATRRAGRPREARSRYLGAATSSVEPEPPVACCAWSIGNELATRAGRDQADYIRDAPTRGAKELDPTRPSRWPSLGYPTPAVRPTYAPLDVLGVNDYFGWYPGPGGRSSTASAARPFLDSIRACYPRQGDHRSRSSAPRPTATGPLEEKGTWAVPGRLRRLPPRASTPPSRGSAARPTGRCNEFRVRPAWEGGNPRPQPPVHQKGLLAYGTLAAQAGVERRAPLVHGRKRPDGAGARPSARG